MAFSTDAAARAQVPLISPNLGSTEAFVKRLLIQGSVPNSQKIFLSNYLVIRSSVVRDDSAWCGGFNTRLGQ
ncbi:hypothetical protein KIN20_007313 [Parelaphostrongylus tenuis]|uniref:Uncharacterized protein n=1 Tax=Parelaphostrongylus tenuis TaxID=148309 RepID=A0AAD5QHR2_PARTN|nr:hypothetical protein KIN20_007313 [Parelaphostrongylus tenuis]